MTAEIWTSLPVRAGGAVASTAARGLAWALALFMQAPLRNAGVAAFVGFSAIASSNALYFQAHRHPAPLFAAPETKAVTAAAPAPVVPAARHTYQPVPVEADTAPGESVTPQPRSAAPAIGNAVVFEVQRKLQAFKLFDATVDGYYGRRTARAIKAFEERVGRIPKGELTQEIVDLILATPIIASAPDAKLLVAPQPLPEAAAVRTPDPLPAPQPLLEAPPISHPVATLLVPAQKTAGRDLPSSPQQAFDIAVDTAGDAIDTILDGVQTMGMTKPKVEVKQPARVDQTAALPTAPLSSLTQSEVGASAADASNDTEVVGKVQRGLASLGFLHGAIDGVAGEATAKAIRNFEVYYNYEVTGRITPGLVDLLVENGAII